MQWLDLKKTLRRTSAPLAMVLPFALWGTAMAAMKPLLLAGSPLHVATLRLLPAGVVLLLAALALGRSAQVDPADRGWLVCFALVDGTLFQWLLTNGLGQTGAGLGSVLIDSQPLMVALLARTLFGEAINPVGWAGLLLGLLGILCLGLPGEVLSHWWLQAPSALGVQAWSHGELWMLGAAAAMAVGTVLSRYASRRSDPVAITAWHMLIGSVPLLAGVLLQAIGILGQPAPLWPGWNGLEWALAAYAALLGSAVAYGLFFLFANSGDLTGFTALTFLTPVFALLCGVLLLNEQLRPLQWLGAALALVSVLLINRRTAIWEGGPPLRLNLDEGRP